MKRLLKVGLALAGGLFLLIGGALIALYLFFPADKIKAKVLSELEQALHREVRLERVRISFLNGIVLDRLSISERPTFQQGTFAAVENLSVRPQWRPLLRKEIKINSITLSRLDVKVIREKDGKTFNFSDLISTGTTTTASLRGAERRSNLSDPDGCSGFIPCAYAGPAPVTRQAGLSVTKPVPAGRRDTGSLIWEISRIDIQKSRLQFVDRATAALSVTIDPLDARIDRFSMDRAFPVELQARIAAMGVTPSIDANMNVNLAQEELDLTQAAIQLGKSRLRAKAQVKQWSRPDFPVSAQIDIEALDPADLKPLAALPPDLRWAGAATGRWTVQGTAALPVLEGSLHLEAVDLAYGQTFVKKAGVPCLLSLKAKKSATALAVPQWGLKLGGNAFTGSARIDGLSEKLPGLTLHAETAALSVPDLAAHVPGLLPADVKLQGPIRLSADVSGTSLSATYSTKADLSATDVRYSTSFAKPAGIPLLAHLTGETLQSGDVIQITKGQVTLASCMAVLSGTVRKQKKETQVALDVKTNLFQVGDLLALSPGTKAIMAKGTAQTQIQMQGSAGNPVLNTSGKANLSEVKHPNYEGRDLALDWNLTGVTPTLEQLSGKANLTQGPGAVLDMESLINHSKTARVLLSPVEALRKLQKKGLLKGVGIPALDRLVLNRIDGRYTFKQGVATIQTFDLLGSDLSINTTGTIGLVGEQARDLTVAIRLAPGAIAGSVGKWLQDEVGRPTIKLRLTGTAEHPKTEFNLQEAGRKAIKELGDILFKRLGSGGGAGTGAPQQPPASAPGTDSQPSQAAPQSKPEDSDKAIEDLGNQLMDLFKKR